VQQGPPFTAQQQPVFPPVLPQQHTPPGHAGRLPGALLDPARGVYTFAPLLDPATNAVVNIAVSTDVPGRTNQLFQDPFFRRFFGLDETPHSRPRQVTAAGSGVIVDAQRGWVVTNAHVVENAARINVTLRDGRSLSARLVGRDPETDIALLELQAQPQGQGPAPGQQASGPAPGLVALPLSDSDQLRVGDVVLAIGNPFGLGQTVTSGIVSALGRSGLNAENYESYIQTDAPINPGNSGGALITSRGELAGINTAIIAPGGGNVGIGFAVPSNIVSVVVQQLAQFGEVRRGRIGIGVQTVTPRVAEALGLGDSRGVAVTNVERGSPAERAGLRPGDVVVELNGRPAQTAAELRNTVGLSQIGTQVQLTYLRAGQRQTVTLAIEPRVDRAASAETGTVPQLEGATFGVRPASNAGSGPGAASGSGSEPGGSGAAGAASREVVASEVRRNSRAWSIGLRPGDVVTAVNRLPVSSVEELRQAAASAVAAVVLEVRRGEDRLVLFAG
jgi:Do/DeqQ family serine protease